jgi:hypothetical protein
MTFSSQLFFLFFFLKHSLTYKYRNYPRPLKFTGKLVCSKAATKTKKRKKFTIQTKILLAQIGFIITINRVCTLICSNKHIMWS